MGYESLHPKRNFLRHSERFSYSFSNAKSRNRMAAGPPVTTKLECACQAVQLKIEGVPTFQVLPSLRPLELMVFITLLQVPKGQIQTPRHPQCWSYPGVQGLRMVQVYCHCQDCRKWHQATPHPAVIFPEECVTIVSGEDKIRNFSLRKKELVRSFCKVRIA